ncbi:GNAT superfamily N-acetyltransferase [Paraburkholderia youngii]|uniref:GNAT family N-acetyltransferase n=1 Tax=Paraburkholderia youngii TaxID=2782701 RepID=UPI003D1B5523
MRCTPVSIPTDASFTQDSLDTGRVIIRPFDPEVDLNSQITKLLRRAVASIDVASNLPVHCQRRERTVHRDTVDEACFVAVCKGRLAGTLTLRGADPVSTCRHFRRPDVATVHRYGVEPSRQRRGIGRALLSFANRWAAAHGYMQLALEAPMNAQGLLDFYRSQGFSLVDSVRFPGCEYESAVLTRPSLPGWPCFRMSRVRYRSR